ncbi:Helix-turn-helix domain-containing protein, partial [Roseicitreum antarcticum]
MSHAATNWAIQQRGLKPTTKIVLWHLCDRFNPDYGCFPSQERLAHDCEIGRATLNRHLDDLEARHLIRRIRMTDRRTGQQRPTRYLLGFEPGFDPSGSDDPGTGGDAPFDLDPPQTAIALIEEAVSAGARRTIHRSTLADWIGVVAFHLRPVVDRLAEHLKGSTKLFMDETTAPVLDPGRGRTKTGYLWALARDDRGWGGADPPGVVFFYAPDRGGQNAETFLRGFDGIVQLDGYQGYNRLTRPSRKGGDPIRV